MSSASNLEASPWKMPFSVIMGGASEAWDCLRIDAIFQLFKHRPSQHEIHFADFEEFFKILLQSVKREKAYRLREGYQQINITPCRCITPRRGPKQFEGGDLELIQLFSVGFQPAYHV